MTETIRDAVATREAELKARPAEGEGVLTLREDQTYWNDRQLAGLKALGIKNASKEDLLVFFHHCQKTGLDPFAKQIYLLERRSWNKAAKQWEYHQTIQVGIDGFRVNAERVAKRRGIHLEYEDTIWFDEAGRKHEIWLEDQPPAGARVVVIKVLSDGTRLRVPGTAKFESYAAYNFKDGEKTGLQSQWAVMPDHMIEKCAEAFALRRAFPQDLGGMYAEEELQREMAEAAAKLPGRIRSYTRDPQASDPGTVPGNVEPSPEDDQARRQANAKINALFRQIGLTGKDHAQVRRAVCTGILNGDNPSTGYADLTQLTVPVVTHIATGLETWIKAREAEDTEITVRDQAIAYADSITAQVTEAEQREAEAQ